MQELAINIVAFACFGCVWVWRLIHPTGLLSFLPRLWSKSNFLTKLMSCASCVAGWCTIAYCLYMQLYSDIFVSTVFAMVTAKLIESKIYGKR